MTQTAMQILPAVDLSRWVPIDTAAPLLGLNRDHLGRMCKEKLQYQNDATFTATPENGRASWFVSRDFDPCLSLTPDQQRETYSDLSRFSAKQQTQARQRMICV